MVREVPEAINWDLVIVILSSYVSKWTDEAVSQKVESGNAGWHKGVVMSTPFRFLDSFFVANFFLP